LLTLLSPAKTLDFSHAPAGLLATGLQFEQDVEVLMERCKKLSVRELRELMSLSEPLAALNHQRFQDMALPFNPQNAKPCVLAFQGDVYKGLDAAGLSKADLRWAQSRLRILSGFYGLLHPLDLIQPYRLEMGVRLETTRGKNLYAFWGNRIVDNLNAEHARRPVKAVVNLASNEYFKAVPIRALKPRLVTPVFQEIRAGKARTISFLAKRARGLMARFIIDKRIDDPDDLRGFDSEGYGYRAEHSDAERLVFTRQPV
jgi:hypothetical protein